ncbi:hypothetical protein C8J56DRAFT_907722 [Mycena floridula]|nr:hypothetical protein C8J56DRAFT_907722 [Mycena floridula]
MAASPPPKRGLDGLPIAPGGNVGGKYPRKSLGPVMQAAFDRVHEVDERLLIDTYCPLVPAVDRIEKNMLHPESDDQPVLGSHRLYAIVIHQFLDLTIGTAVRYEVYQPKTVNSDDPDNSDNSGSEISDDPDNLIPEESDPGKKYAYGVVVEIRCSKLATENAPPEGLRIGVLEFWREPIDSFDDELVKDILYPEGGVDGAVRLLATSHHTWVSAGAIRSIPTIQYCPRDKIPAEIKGFLVTDIYYPDVSWNKVPGRCFSLFNNKGHKIWPWEVTGIHDDPNVKPRPSKFLYAGLDLDVSNNPLKVIPNRYMTRKEKIAREEASVKARKDLPEATNT